MKRIGCILTALLLAFAPFSGTSARAEEYSLPREEGTRQVTFYWQDEGADYDTCDMWIWYPNADGHGYLFHPCAYGVKVVLNVPESENRVGFIVRRNCSDPGGASWGEATKDYDGDRYAEITGDTTEVYLLPGDENQYKSDDGGKTLYQEKRLSMVGITAMNEIQYHLNPAVRLESTDQVKITDRETGRRLEVTGLSSLNNNVITGKITVGEELDLSRTYTVGIEGYGEITAVPTGVFDSAGFNEKYVYDGDDLGATLTENGTQFKVWAPTASRVQVLLYEAANPGDSDETPVETVEMTRGEKGVWTGESACGAMTYYTYKVTTAVGEQEAVDPYAKAAGVNGNRGVIVDLRETDPEGFDRDTFIDSIRAYNEAVIWEVHVRDFSNRLESSKYPGKYLAFTEHGLTNAAGEPAGIDYLTDLGITHVHLQPVYDFATVDEETDEPQFNWGYDPKNYNVPEGSYATDALDARVRINEFKQMVQALHASGLGVIMDVVYNHTYDGDSCLNRIVPYYYYRFDSSGGWSNGSGCGNETASERAMFRKYIVDSVTYWAKEYHVDGFRFDLMALHDIETMQAVETAVHAVNPKAILYGEGWTGGSSPLHENKRASQSNIKKVKASDGAIGAVAVFNDSTRDGLKGSVFNAREKGYISGMFNRTNAGQIAFGLTGGVKNTMVSWSVPDNGVINYMACHDNHTLYDRLQNSNPENSPEERLKMNRFGISIIMIGKGIPFFLAGEEMLRSKGGDSNSYKSSDEVNNIRWDDLAPGSDVMDMRDFYRSLIRIRKTNRFITEADVTCEVLDNCVIEIRWTQDEKLTAYALINPGSDRQFTLQEGEWEALLLNEMIEPDSVQPISGTITVQGRTVLLLKAR
ncbi:MAG: type I pullulanase [Clostridia bacterium]|nr:type I pullulanase [Clostridia bacterium]